MQSREPRVANARTFLELILPAEGYYVAAVLLGKGMHQIVCDSIERLAETLIFHDDQGFNVYHACASFRHDKVGPGTVGVRTHDNALCAKSFWLDVDCHPSVPGFSDGWVAATTILAFCRRRSLPEPVFVGSGNGIHCYWPLQECLGPHEWETYARGLKALCVEDALTVRFEGKNYGVDPARTSDISSVLRTPGTHWRKHGQEREVEWAGGEACYFAGRFGCLGRAARQEPSRGVQTHTRKSVAASVADRIASTSESAYASPTADYVADRCAQVARFRNSGNLPEPEWFPLIGVTAYCSDGHVKTHEWSANDFPEYSYVQTQNKIDRVLALSGATTCAKLNDGNPGVCEICPFWQKIGSPISVGEILPKPSTRPRVAALSDGYDSGATSVAGGELLPPIPAPFAWSSTQQLIAEVEGKGGKKEHQVICENPIYLTSVRTAELDSGTHAYSFRHILPHDGPKDFAVPAKEAVGARAVSTFADKGVTIHDGQDFAAYIRLSVDAYHKAQGLGMTYDQFGWKEDGTKFLCGNRLYSQWGAEVVPLSPTPDGYAQYFEPSKNGCRESWTDAADVFFAPGLEPLSMGVLCSLGAPFMYFMERSEGGCVYHAFGKTGSGKTGMMRVSWTFWGHKRALELTGEDSALSKPRKLGMLGNLPATHDENAEKDPVVMQKFLQVFTAGQDRQRLTKDGDLRNNKANWSTIMISGSNRSIVEHLTGLGDDADAMAQRLFQPDMVLPVKDANVGEKAKKVLETNVGWAGDYYLRYITQPDVLKWIHESLEKWQDDLAPNLKARPENRFRRRLLICCMVAGQIANHIGLLNFQVSRILEWALRQMEGMNAIAEDSSAIEVQELLAAYLQEFYMWDALRVTGPWDRRNPGMPVQTPKRELHIRHEIKPARLYLDQRHFRQWVLSKRNASMRAVTAALEEKGLLEAVRGCTLGAGTDIPVGVVKCLVIDASHPAVSGTLHAVASITDQQRFNPNGVIGNG